MSSQVPSPGASVGRHNASTTLTPPASLICTRRSLVLGSTSNGFFSAPNWGSSTLQPNSFKVPLTMDGSKGIMAAASSGLQVGIIVDASTTLQALLLQVPNQVYYNIFSTDLKYCPVGFSYPPTN